MIRLFICPKISRGVNWPQAKRGAGPSESAAPKRKGRVE